MNCPLCEGSNIKQLGSLDGRDAMVLACKACGRFAIDPLALEAIRTRFADNRHLISSSVRAASDRDTPPTITPESLDALAAEARPRGQLPDMVDRLLLLLAGRTKEYWESPRFDPYADWPLLSARGEREFAYLFDLATERGYIDRGQQNRLSAKGWERIEGLLSSQPKGRQAFVAMWFDPQMDDAWLNGLKPGIEDTEYFRPLRISDVHHNDKIDDRIVAEIKRSGLLVADFTGHRGGVYFEAGLAMGLGIPVIWTCRADDVGSTHFDTRQYNHIVWEDSADLRTRLKDRLLATVVPSASSRTAS